jgi:2-polyprenyl-3-methyl-5-hydroxy-6-metoxy-1,4-benzoquinol methylase
MDYKRIEEEESPQALRLARWIEKNLFPKSLIDFGCATGFYLYPYKNIERIVGIDYYSDFPAEGHMTVDCDIEFMNLDLRNSITKYQLGRFDLGLCLEVAEHIDEKFENQFIDTLAEHCRTLIFSAAPPGQTGDGHINLKAKVYWLKHFERRGMLYDAFESQSMLGYMQQGAHMGWFRNNAFIVTGRY